jgi:hypothetical protein
MIKKYLLVCFLIVGCEVGDKTQDVSKDVRSFLSCVFDIDVSLRRGEGVMGCSDFYDSCFVDYYIGQDAQDLLDCFKNKNDTMSFAVKNVVDEYYDCLELVTDDDLIDCVDGYLSIVQDEMDRCIDKIDMQSCFDLYPDNFILLRDCLHVSCACYSDAYITIDSSYQLCF